MRTLARYYLILPACLSAATCWAELAEWSVVSVTTAPFERESTKGPPEVRMSIHIRNTSDRTVYLWGQDFG